MIHKHHIIAVGIIKKCAACIVLKLVNNIVFHRCVNKLMILLTVLNKTLKCFLNRHILFIVFPSSEAFIGCLLDVS